MRNTWNRTMDCDSDADTVCMVMDSESETERDSPRRNTVENEDRRSISPCTTRSAAQSGRPRILSDDVIYVAGSGSESEEEDCVIVDGPLPLTPPVRHSGQQAGDASRLPEDFFDCETPPASPQRILQDEVIDLTSLPYQPKVSSSRNLEKKNKNIQLRDVRVRLPRIDELFLNGFLDSSRTLGPKVTHSEFDTRISNTMQPTSTETRVNGKHKSKIQVNNNTRKTAEKLIRTEMSPRDVNCKDSSRVCDSVSPEKCRKIRITVDVPISKLEEFKKRTKSLLQSPNTAERSHKINKGEKSRKKEEKSYMEVSVQTVSKDARRKEFGTSNNGNENVTVKEIDVRNSFEAREQCHKSKRHSSCDKHSKSGARESKEHSHKTDENVTVKEIDVRNSFTAREQFHQSMKRHSSGDKHSKSGTRESKEHSHKTNENVTVKEIDVRNSFKAREQFHQSMKRHSSGDEHSKSGTRESKEHSHKTNEYVTVKEIDVRNSFKAREQFHQSLKRHSSGDKHSKFGSRESKEHCDKSNEKKRCLEMKGKKSSKSERRRSSCDEMSDSSASAKNLMDDRTPQEQCIRDSVLANKHSKSLKNRRSSSDDIKYRCEICWLRVSNVADHILQEHGNLFS